MRIKNNSNRVLGLPGAVAVSPGATVDAPDAVAENRIVAAWIGRGILSIEGDAPAPVKRAEPDSAEPSEADAKAGIIAELSEYGVVRDKRTSLPNLQALLDEVREERAGQSADEEPEVD